MKKLLMVMALPVVLMAGGCGLFGADEIWFNLPDQEFEFALDTSVVRNMLQQHLDDNGIPLNISQLDELPAEVGGQPININETFVLETPPEQIDISNEEDLKNAKAVKSVEIKYVQYDIGQNSLNFDVPELQLFMGAYDVQTAAQATLIAVVQAITAGFTGVDDVQFAEGGRDVMSNLLLQYKFAFIGKVKVVIDTSKSRAIPSGQMSGKVIVGVRFSIDTF